MTVKSVDSTDCSSDEYRLVKVTWKDIHGIEGVWVDFDEAAQLTPATVETVGWIIIEDDCFMTLVSSFGDEKTFCGSITSIPIGCILSVLLISEGTVDILPLVREREECKEIEDV